MAREKPFTPINNIKAIREKRNLSLRALAELAGTTATTLNRFVRGGRDLGFEWLRRIAKALQVLPADLLLEEDGGTSTAERLAREKLQSS